MSANAELAPGEVQEQMEKIVEGIEKEGARESASKGSSGSTISLFNFKRRPIQGGQRPGRNTLCSCGSKKKYKSCCLPTERENYQKQQISLEQQLQVRELKDANDKKEIREKQKEKKDRISSAVAASQSTEGVGGDGVTKMGIRF